MSKKSIFERFKYRIIATGVMVAMYSLVSLALVPAFPVILPIAIAALAVSAMAIAIPIAVGRIKHNREKKLERSKKLASMNRSKFGQVENAKSMSKEAPAIDRDKTFENQRPTIVQSTNSTQGKTNENPKPKIKLSEELINEIFDARELKKNVPNPVVQDKAIDNSKTQTNTITGAKETSKAEVVEPPRLPEDLTHKSNKLTKEEIKPDKQVQASDLRGDVKKIVNNTIETQETRIRQRQHNAEIQHIEDVGVKRKGSKAL